MSADKYVNDIIKKYSNVYKIHISQLPEKLIECINHNASNMSGCEFAEFVNVVIYAQTFQLGNNVKLRHFDFIDSDSEEDS